MAVISMGRTYVGAACAAILTHACFVDTEGYRLKSDEDASSNAGAGGVERDGSVGGGAGGHGGAPASGGSANRGSAGTGVGGTSGTSSGGAAGAAGGSAGIGGGGAAGNGGSATGGVGMGGAGGANTGGTAGVGGVNAGGTSGAGGVNSGGSGGASTGGAAGGTGGPVTNPCGAGCDGTRADCNKNASDGFEADLANDVTNCGACGFDCGGGACKNGTCTGTVLAPAVGFSVSDLLIDDSNLYWPHAPADALPKTGGSVTPLASGQGNSSWIALDTDHVYCALQGTGTAAIMRVGKTGTGVETLFPNLSSPFSVSVDGAWVYWTASGTLNRGQIGQSTVFPLATNATAVVSAGGTAYYQAGGTNGTLWALAQGASAAVEVAKPVGAATRMKAVNGRVYYCPGTSCSSGVVSAPATGGATLAYSTGAVAGYDADDAFLYATTSTGLLIFPNIGGTPTYLTQIAGNGVAVDDAFIYFQEYTSKDIRRIPKPLSVLGSGTCTPGRADCNGGADGCETDVWNDAHNCGTCGRDCGTGTCVGGSCKAETVATNPNCGGAGEGLWADANFIYWRSQTSVTKVPLGPGVSTPLVTGLASVFSRVAFDGSYVYYGDASANIVRVSTAGGSSASVVPGANLKSQIAVDGTDVFWVSTTNIATAPIATGTIQNLAPESGFVADLIVDSQNVYWVSSGATINRVHRDGTGLTALASNLSFVRALAADANYIYWGNETTGEIMRVGKDGTGATQISWGARPPLYGITVQGGYVYWSSQQQIFKARVTGGPPTLVAYGSDPSHGFLFLGSSLYWAGCGTVYRVGL